MMKPDNKVTVDVRISTKIPEIYAQLHKEFGVEWDRGLVITYHPFIHTKDDAELLPDLIAHESVHLHQQSKFTALKDGKEFTKLDGPAGWWERYLSDPGFRLAQEIAAYMVQVNYIKENYNPRQYRRKHFRHILDAFSRMYGGIITEEEAKRILKI